MQCWAQCRVLRWVLRWAPHSAREACRLAKDGRPAGSESHGGVRSEVSPEPAQRSGPELVRPGHVAVSRHGRRARPAERSARAGLRRVAPAQAPVPVPVLAEAVAVDAALHPDAAAAVEAQPQAGLDARVRPADGPAAAARHGERVAAARDGPQGPAVPPGDAEARPLEPEAAPLLAVQAARHAAAPAAPALARCAAAPWAASCLRGPFADRERLVPSEMMTMVRHEQIATWKMRRSRAVSISACSYPPFDDCPSARFIDITRRHARWTDNGEAAMWRGVR